MIKINVKGLAQFMSSDDARRRRRILAGFKFPDLGKAPRGYYREAIPAIRSFVAGEITRIQLLNRADALSKEAAAAKGARGVPRFACRITAALQNIEALWPSIVRPVKRVVQGVSAPPPSRLDPSS